DPFPCFEDRRERRLDPRGLPFEEGDLLAEVLVLPSELLVLGREPCEIQRGVTWSRDRHDRIVPPRAPTQQHRMSLVTTWLSQRQRANRSSSWSSDPRWHGRSRSRACSA